MAKKAAKRPGRGSDKLDLRFPDGMRDQLYRLAEANGRSANSEIIERLRLSIESDNQKSLRDLVEDQDILRTEVAYLRGMVEKLKQDQLARDAARDDATYAKLKKEQR
jgi:hypothetical protein